MNRSWKLLLALLGKVEAGSSGGVIYLGCSVRLREWVISCMAN